MPRKVTLCVRCPHCLEDLKDEHMLISNQPAVHLKIRLPDGQESQLWLSSIYNDFNIFSDIFIPDQTIVEFFCPHCEQPLVGADVACNLCGAPVLTFLCKLGGKVHICSRSGCQNHYFIFDDIDTAVKNFKAEYETS